MSECFLCLKARHIADGYDTADESIWEQISYNLHHAKLAALERENKDLKECLYKALSHQGARRLRRLPLTDWPEQAVALLRRMEGP